MYQCDGSKGRALGSATPDGELPACTITVSVLAAHSFGLRTWLRSGAD